MHGTADLYGSDFRDGDVHENTAASSGGAAHGGGVAVIGQEAPATGLGGAIYAGEDVDTQVRNCTIANNISGNLAGGIYADNYASTFWLYNSILYDNVDSNGSVESSQIILGTTTASWVIVK